MIELVKGDSKREADGTFYWICRNISKSHFSKNRRIGTILNDDGAQRSAPGPINLGR